jgi:hypothetical protein
MLNVAKERLAPESIQDKAGQHSNGDSTERRLKLFRDLPKSQGEYMVIAQGLDLIKP